jgi:hypothetical protein
MESFYVWSYQCGLFFLPLIAISAVAVMHIPFERRDLVKSKVSAGLAGLNRLKMYLPPMDWPVLVKIMTQRLIGQDRQIA